MTNELIITLYVVFLVIAIFIMFLILRSSLKKAGLIENDKTY